LSRHRKIHTRPYRCENCDLGFALRHDLLRHKAKHGSIDRRFYCKWPGCSFKGTSRGDNLLKHMRNTHERQKPRGRQVMQDEVRTFYKESIKEQKSSTEALSLLKAVHNGNSLVVTLLLE